MKMKAKFPDDISYSKQVDICIYDRMLVANDMQPAESNSVHQINNIKGSLDQNERCKFSKSKG